MTHSTELFAAMAVRRAIALYRKTGIKANSAYTPTAMLLTASRYTGQTYRRGQLALAEQQLAEWIEKENDQ